jgi:hypothetical protein
MRLKKLLKIYQTISSLDRIECAETEAIILVNILRKIHRKLGGARELVFKTFGEKKEK